MHACAVLVLVLSASVQVCPSSSNRQSPTAHCSLLTARCSSSIRSPCVIRSSHRVWHRAQLLLHLFLSLLARISASTPTHLSPVRKHWYETLRAPAPAPPAAPDLLPGNHQLPAPRPDIVSPSAFRLYCLGVARVDLVPNFRWFGCVDPFVGVACRPTVQSPFSPTRHLPSDSCLVSPLFTSLATPYLPRVPHSPSTHQTHPSTWVFASLARLCTLQLARPDIEFAILGNRLPLCRIRRTSF